MVLREADVLFLPPRFSNHLLFPLSNNQQKLHNWKLNKKRTKLEKGSRETRKKNRPLGEPETRRTPPWSTILVARSKFLPNKKCKLSESLVREREGVRDWRAKWLDAYIDSWSSETVEREKRLELWWEEREGGDEIGKGREKKNPDLSERTWFGPRLNLRRRCSEQR